MKRFTIALLVLTIGLNSFSQISYRSFSRYNYKLDIPTFLELKNSDNGLFEFKSNFSEVTTLKLLTFENPKTKNVKEYFEENKKLFSSRLSNFRSEYLGNSFIFYGTTKDASFGIFVKFIVNSEKISQLYFEYDFEVSNLMQPVCKRFEISFEER